MIFIQDSNDTFHKVIKNNKTAIGKNYRLLSYCLLQDVDEGKLLYNTLTNELLLLNDIEEIHDTETLKYLQSHWFIVNEDFDDKKFVHQVRKLKAMLLPPPKGITGYTIITTTDCNARCFYCCEKVKHRTPMTEATAIKVADYITANYLKQPADKRKSPRLIWFGGEPLFNQKVITIISDRLHDNEVPFTSRMTTNGFLINKHVAELATSKWNVDTVQISLDGTEEIYNRIKAYIDRTDESPYKKVLNNIDLLLDSDIKVNIRFNIDLYNADDLMKLANELIARFGKRKGFYCYTHPLFESTTSDKSPRRTEETRAKVYEKQDELQQILKNHKLLASPKLPKDIKISHCMADSNCHQVISPNGDLSLCDFRIEDEFFSHIDHPEVIDKDIVRSFAEHCEDLPICNDCAFYPLCIRLKKCDEGSLCFPEIKERNILKIKNAMIKKYNDWKKSKYETQEEDTSAHDLELC